MNKGKFFSVKRVAPIAMIPILALLEVLYYRPVQQLRPFWLKRQIQSKALVATVQILESSVNLFQRIAV
jgi:hypothetical protein